MTDGPTAARSRMRRGWPRALVWLQLGVGWLPILALYTALIFTQHQPVTFARAMTLAIRSLLPAALLGILVYQFAKRVPWPRPFRMRFALIHLIAAPTYAIAWILAASIVESVIHRQLMIIVGPGLLPFLVLGVWLYVMVAGISYAIDGTERVARAEAAGVRMQLGALRAQLHPHFLFNALHTVVQLIPVNPRGAADAAEQVAGLLRIALQEDRDLISLRDEWAFVQKYLELERIRFGDRLRVHAEIDATLLASQVPSFALQTLVENAVRHGAAPRVEATDITISTIAGERTLTLEVRDTGSAVAPRGVAGNGTSGGTGLARLRDRLAVLYGDASSLAVKTSPDGCTATLVLPRSDEE
ncbi:MAG: histidine kinase [Gemmatimonadota bacterium]|nr:histidine kinase [Gemmatimonadota bacterium]